MRFYPFVFTSTDEGGIAAYYNYTADGERNIKLTSPRLNIQQNASLFNNPPLLFPTLYASPLITLTPKGYTKHYFEEGRRICSKIGGGMHGNVTVEEIDSRVPELAYNYDEQYHYQYDGIRQTFHDCIEADPQIIDGVNLHHMLVEREVQRDEDEPAFFYHGDHLGSAAYLTYHGGVVQTLNYLPYGEDWVEYNFFHPDDTTRLGIYRFNGKEKDYESGFHYYGARYYWSEVLTGWLSVDPMMDKYPGISPYCYCMWNPVVLVDPDGNFPWDVHVKIVSDALNNKRFNSHATKIILFGTGKYADWVLFPFSNVHLDNKSGFANIAKSYSSAISKAISHLSNGNYLRAGKNLHTIADFYSHSNYVDLYSQYATEKGLTMDPELIPTFTDMMNNADFIEFANAHGGLKTGSFNTFSWLYEKACKKMGHPIPPQEGSHTSINLDSDESINGSQRFDNRQSNSPTKHQVARRLAEREIENVVNISIEQ